MTYYVPGYEPTENYYRGMVAVEQGELQVARYILSQEPRESPCYGMALANVSQTEIRLERYDDGRISAQAALDVFMGNSGCPHPPTFIQSFRNLGECLGHRDRLREAVNKLEAGCTKADELIAAYPDSAVDCELEKGHLLNSLAGTHLQLLEFEAALGHLINARAIYRKYPGNSVGQAEVLTTLGQVYHHLHRDTEAKLSLDEAADHAKDDPDQLQRVKTALARMNLLEQQDKEEFFVAAETAKRERRFENAYLQYCITAYLASEIGDYAWGQRAIDLAESVVAQLPLSSLHPAKLSFYRAVFREKLGGSSEEVTRLLIEGARLWCERLPGTLQPADYQESVGMMHDHFRMLGARLVDVGRKEEAFVAFEMGRARAFAAQALGNYDHPFLNQIPFSEDNVDCALLDRIKRGLKRDEVVISIAVLAPKIVAFVVGNWSLETCEFSVPLEPEQYHALSNAIRSLPEALHAGKGRPAIPVQILDLAVELAKIIAGRSVVLISPHNLLHQVPWRAILRDAGVPWDQLGFVTQFSPLLDPDHPNPDLVLKGEVIALGHGASENFNLEDEAKEFTNKFSPPAVYRVASKAEVQRALLNAEIVMLSCHGQAVSKRTTLLELKDGGFSPEELVVQPLRCVLLVLSACESGVYGMIGGDYPVGAAPTLLLQGIRFCVCTRFNIGVEFAKDLFPRLAVHLAANKSIGKAFAAALNEMEKDGADMWRGIACVELVSRGIS